MDPIFVGVAVVVVIALGVYLIWFRKDDSGTGGTGTGGDPGTGDRY